MAELTTLARPYAKAAFEHAQAHQQLASWSAMLGLAAAVSARRHHAARAQGPAPDERRQGRHVY